MRLISWLSSITAGVLGGSIGGALFGDVLARVSYDYVMVPSESLIHGAQLGLLAGAIVAACQILGHCPSAGPAVGVLGLLGAALAAAVGVVVGAAVGYAAYHWGWLDVTGWRLPNPSRHALVTGALRGLDTGTMAGILGAGFWVLRRRRCGSR